MYVTRHCLRRGLSRLEPRTGGSGCTVVCAARTERLAVAPRIGIGLVVDLTATRDFRTQRQRGVFQRRPSTDKSQPGRHTLGRMTMIDEADAPTLIRHCPVCDQDMELRSVETVPWAARTAGEHLIFRCGNCGLLQSEWNAISVPSPDIAPT
jgi:hypothetical protein